MTTLKSPDSYFIQVDIEFATKYGLNEAALAGKMLRLQEKLTGAIDDDGNKWIRLTLEEWSQELPFLTEMTIRRTIERLETEGVLLSRTFSGRSKWYRLNPEHTEAKHNVIVQNEQKHYDNCSNCTDVSVQNEQLPRVLSYNTTPNGVNGKPLPAPKKTKTPIQEKSDKPGPRKQLMGTFLNNANMIMPREKPTIGFWWSQITEIEHIVEGDVALGQSLIAETIRDMRHEGLTISGPKSIVNVLRAKYAARASPNGNGHHIQLSAEERAALEAMKR